MFSHCLLQPMNLGWYFPKMEEHSGAKESLMYQCGTPIYINIFQIVMICADFPTRQCWKTSFASGPRRLTKCCSHPGTCAPMICGSSVTGEAAKLTTALGPKTLGSLQRKSCNTRPSILSDWSQLVHSLDKQCQSLRKSDMILRYTWLSQTPLMIQTSIDTYDRKTIHGYLCDCLPFNQSSDHHPYTSSAPGHQSASRVASSQESIHSVKGRPGWKAVKLKRTCETLQGCCCCCCCCCWWWVVFEPTPKMRKNKTQKRTWNIII